MRELKKHCLKYFSRELTPPQFVTSYQTRVNHVCLFFADASDFTTASRDCQLIEHHAEQVDEENSKRQKSQYCVGIKSWTSPILCPRLESKRIK